MILNVQVVVDVTEAVNPAAFISTVAETVALQIDKISGVKGIQVTEVILESDDPIESPVEEDPVEETDV